MNIESSKISVVIQGPIVHRSYQYTEDSITHAAVKSVRSLLPDAEIILSTWKGEHFQSALLDRIIESKDPGAQRSKADTTPNNVNRQIISTVSGLNQASKKYCLKLRTDIVLNSTNFLDHFMTDTQERPYGLFQQKIITNNLTSRNPERYFQSRPFFNWKLLFHLSDHVQFGLTSDLLLLWDIPSQSEAEADHFIRNIHPERFRLNETSRFSPEQYIAINCLKKKFEIDLVDYSDWSLAKEAQSESLLRSNFIFLEDSKFSIDFPKYHTAHESRFERIRYSSTDNRKPLGKPSPTPEGTGHAIGKVSIVVPVHNSWPYFPDCLGSILAQSYSDLDVVLVNDHSVQPELLSYLDTLPGIDTRIRVFNSSHKGANFARKLGAEAAIGDYVLIMDSDDLLDPHCIRLLVASATCYHSDVVLFGFDVFDSLTQKTLQTFTPHLTKPLTNYRAAPARDITDITSHFNHTFWVHFFKRGKMNLSCLSLGLIYYEEIPAIASLYAEENTFSFVCAPLYKYRTGQPGQLTSAWKDSDREQKLIDLNTAIETAISQHPSRSAAQAFLRQKTFSLIAAEVLNAESTDRFSQTVSYSLIRKAAKHALEAPELGLWKTQGKRYLYLLALTSMNRKSFINVLTVHARIKGFFTHMALGVLTLIGLR